MKGTIKVDGKENRLVIENENGDEVAFTFIDQCTDLKLASGHITVYDGHTIDPEELIHVKSESGEEVGQIFMNQYEGVNFNFSDAAIDDMLDSDWGDDPY